MEQKKLDLDPPAALFVKEAFANEEVREWLPVSVMYSCPTATDDLYTSRIWL